MEYIYAALMLHTLGKKIDEGAISNILKAAGAQVDEARVKALTSALEGINIDEAIKSVSLPTIAAPSPQPSPAPAPAEEKKEEKKPEEEEKKEEEALAGLGALFG